MIDDIVTKANDMELLIQAYFEDKKNGIPWKNPRWCFNPT